jgi:hypothetical protein
MPQARVPRVPYILGPITSWGNSACGGLVQLRLTKLHTHVLQDVRVCLPYVFVAGHGNTLDVAGFPCSDPLACARSLRISPAVTANISDYTFYMSLDLRVQ